MSLSIIAKSIAGALSQQVQHEDLIPEEGTEGEHHEPHEPPHIHPIAPHTKLGSGDCGGLFSQIHHSGHIISVDLYHF